MVRVESTMARTKKTAPVSTPTTVARKGGYIRTTEADKLYEVGGVAYMERVQEGPRGLEGQYVVVLDKWVQRGNLEHVKVRAHGQELVFYVNHAGTADGRTIHTRYPYLFTHFFTTDAGVQWALCPPNIRPGVPGHLYVEAGTP